MPREGFQPPQYEIRLRTFTSLAALVAVLGIGAVFMAVVVLFSWPNTDVGSPTARVFTGTVDEFTVGKPVTFVEGRFHLVKRDDGSFIALSWKDVHSGCTVPWRPDFVFPDRAGHEIKGWFRDPCHGATYDAFGVRVFGPAARNLDQFPVEVVGDEVYVLATEEKLILGENPQWVDSDP